MDALVILIILLPLIAVALLAAGNFFNDFSQADGAKTAAELGFWGLVLTALQTVLLASADLFHENNGLFSLGPWMSSGDLTIRLNFITTGLRPFLAFLFAVLMIMLARRGINAANGRYYWLKILSLTAALLLFLLAGNAGLALVGWAITGYIAASFTVESGLRPAVFATSGYIAVVHRIGDAAFIAGIGLSYFWMGGVSWNTLTVSASQLSVSEATGISVCFLLAAMTKSAQLPFTLSMVRSLASPQSAGYQILLSHIGIVLVLELQPIFEQTPLPRILLVLVGLATALYSHLVSLTQVSSQSTFAFSVSCQLGLMFIECGLGWWRLAIGHLCLHLMARVYYLVADPVAFISFDDSFKKRIKRFFALSWLGSIRLPRYWLGQLIEWGMIKPVSRLAADMAYFEVYFLSRYIDKIIIRMLPQLFAVAIEPSPLPAFSESRRISRRPLPFWRRVGRAAAAFEHSVLKPRYLALFVFITLLVAF